MTMQGNIQKIDGKFPVTLSEAVYINKDTTLKDYFVNREGAVNVKDFGAQGDGITDDSVSIQRAVDHLAYSGGEIYFPPGIYKINNYITFYSKQRFTFNNATILRGTSAIRALLVADADSQTGGYDGVHDVVIDGGYFDMNADIAEKGGAILFIHATKITIKNCKFFNLPASWHYIEANASQFVTIEDCWFGDLKTTGRGAELIQLDGAVNDKVYPFAGLKDSTGCNYITIRRNEFIGNKYSPAIGNHTNCTHTNVFIYNNTFRNFLRDSDTDENSRAVIDFQSTLMNYVYVYNNSFSDNNKCVKYEGVNRALFFYSNICNNTTYQVSIGFQTKNNIVNDNFA